jgi:hypothetical protein
MCHAITEGLCTSRTGQKHYTLLVSKTDNLVGHCTRIVVSECLPLVLDALLHATVVEISPKEMNECLTCDVGHEIYENAH